RRKQRPGAIGYGPEARQAPVFWILAEAEGETATSGVGLHISFQARDPRSVDEFHATALRCGARDAGQPGVRPHYTMPFYGAFVVDLDGFKIEAVCRAAMPSLHLREALPGDAAAVNACVQAAYAPWVERIGRKPWPMLQDYAAVIREQHVVIAEADGEL